MRSSSSSRERRAAGAWCAAAALWLTLTLAAAAGAQPFPILAGDPIDPAQGTAYPILPGVPLFLPDADGKYDPSRVDPSVIGDVDLVVRAGSVAVGPGIPGPAATPVVALAGGVRVAPGTELPFTVVASDGDPGSPVGRPLPGPELDDVPVVVFAFADLDGDGVIGPTNADPDGAADNVRELQETFPVGRRAALFAGGVARGSLAVWKGAPGSAGGLRVVLTAGAYIGHYTSLFMEGNVPLGPAVATLMPFFPRSDPTRVVDALGRGGRATPEVRLGVELEAAFPPPVDDPTLGTSFALPTDGSSPTIDRAVVESGALSRLRFVRPSSAAAVPLNVEIPLARGAAGELFEPLESIDVPDDGPGGAVHARLVPADALDNVTDPPPGTTATLVAGPGLAIVSPDTDGDSAREAVPVAGAAGIDVALDDAGASGDSGSGATLTVALAGVPVETLAVVFTPAGPPTAAPVIRLAEIVGQPPALGLACAAARSLLAVVDDAQGDVSAVTVDLTLAGVAAGSVTLAPGSAPPGVTLPAGSVFVGTLPAPAAVGSLTLTFGARDLAGNVAVPIERVVPVVDEAPPVVSLVTVTPTLVPADTRAMVVVTARVADDCGLRRVVAEIDRGRGFRHFVRLRDRGRRGDAVAHDGVFTGSTRLRLRAGSFPLRVTARNTHGTTGTGAVPNLQAVP